MNMTADDLMFMKAALRLAAAGLGRTAPNPMVGAVVVKNGRLLAGACHKCYGETHAERAALEKISVSGSTLYTTLEPCCHHGKTPPCTDIIIEKKVARVVIANNDPCSLVNGRGLARLRKAGIKVTLGVLAASGRYLNRHYFTTLEKGRPYVAIHAGLSLDGKLSDKKLESRWITPAGFRMLSHELRGEFSAILAGAQTIRTDDPLLNIRHPSWQRKKLFRIVLNPENNLAPGARIFSQQEDFPTFVFSSKQAADLTPRVERHYFLDLKNGRFDLSELLALVYENGVQSLLVEGGGETIDAFLERGIWDEMILFQARKIIGGEKSIQVYPSGVNDLAKALSFADFRTWETPGGTVIRGLH